LKVRIDALTQRNIELEEIIRQLRFNTDLDALKVLQQLRGDQSASFTPDVASLLISDGHTEGIYSSDATEGIEAPLLHLPDMAFFQ
jgi:hypothetical protein